MSLFKEKQFINQTEVDNYMSKYNPPNAPLWFNVKTWLASFIKEWDKKQALDFLNPLDLNFPVLGFNWQVHAYKNKTNSPHDYTHKAGGQEIKSSTHEGGYAIDFASDTHLATYSFFRYLVSLQDRGAKFRVMISMHNYHIHIDNEPKNYGLARIEDTPTTSRPYNPDLDNDVRKRYKVKLNPDQEESGEFEKYFGLYKSWIFGILFLIMALLILFKGGKK